MEDLGLNVILPSFLNGRRQFTSSEANESRHVTKLRWVVEAVNARIKQFKFFSNTIQNSSLPFLEQYLLITCAMINRYQLPVKSNQQNDLEIAEKMAALKIQKKNFDSVWALILDWLIIVYIRSQNFQFLNNQGLKRNSSLWKQCNHTDIDDFPMLTEEEIVSNITLGKRILIKESFVHASFCLLSRNVSSEKSNLLCRRTILNNKRERINRLSRVHFRQVSEHHQNTDTISTCE